MLRAHSFGSHSTIHSSFWSLVTIHHSSPHTCHGLEKKTLHFYFSQVNQESPWDNLGGRSSNWKTGQWTRRPITRCLTHGRDSRSATELDLNPPHCRFRCLFLSLSALSFSILRPSCYFYWCPYLVWSSLASTVSMFSSSQSRHA